MLTEEQLNEMEQYNWKIGLPQDETQWLINDIRTLQQQNKQLVEALEEAEAEMEQWRDARHAMACVKVIVNRVLQSIKGDAS